MTDMMSNSVEIFSQKMIDKCPDAHPVLIYDKRSQFVNHDFELLLIENSYIYIPTRIKNPGTTDKVERVKKSHPTTSEAGGLRKPP